MKEENITVIAGGSGGIGRSVVRKFLRKGDRVIVIDLNKITDENITIKNKNKAPTYVDTLLGGVERVRTSAPCYRPNCLANSPLHHLGTTPYIKKS